LGSVLSGGAAGRQFRRSEVQQIFLHSNFPKFLEQEFSLPSCNQAGGKSRPKENRKIRSRE
jgi:hypothetical protein